MFFTSCLKEASKVRSPYREFQVSTLGKVLGLINKYWRPARKTCMLFNPLHRVTVVQSSFLHEYFNKQALSISPWNYIDSPSTEGKR